MTAPEIQQEIERTREHLGETVEELAAKADVKARARVKAAELKAKAQDKAIQVSGRVRDKTADLPGRVKARAADVSERVKRSQVTQRRWPLAVTAGIVVVGAAVIWRRRKA
jgi:phage-related minor tail protein